MKCVICGKECTGKTCSGACRAKLSRRTPEGDNDKAHAHAHAHAHAEPILEAHAHAHAHAEPRLSVTEVSVTEQTNKPEQLYYLLVPEDKVYHRQAVKYIVDGFDTRPIPDNVEDKPVKGNRGRYKREDGSQYQIDDAGISHQLELIDGNYRVCLV